jgi:hypothetical protein
MSFIFLLSKNMHKAAPTSQKMNKNTYIEDSDRYLQNKTSN